MATSSGPAEIRDPHKRPMAGKRFEMPGFHPEDHIRQMQRFAFGEPFWAKRPDDTRLTRPIGIRSISTRASTGGGRSR